MGVYVDGCLCEVVLNRNAEQTFTLVFLLLFLPVTLLLLLVLHAIHSDLSVDKAERHAYVSSWAKTKVRRLCYVSVGYKSQLLYLYYSTVDIVLFCLIHESVPIKHGVIFIIIHQKFAIAYLCLPLVPNIWGFCAAL